MRYVDEFLTFFFFFSSRRRHTRYWRDWSSDVCSSDLDYVTLLKSATAGRDFVRAYAYTGLDPENENQKNFHSFLARHGFKVVSKDIRKYGDGKVKANLDIELVVDLMKTARNLDVAVVVSGDGDFA